MSTKDSGVKHEKYEGDDDEDRTGREQHLRTAEVAKVRRGAAEPTARQQGVAGDVAHTLPARALVQACAVASGDASSTSRINRIHSRIPRWSLTPIHAFSNSFRQTGQKTRADVRVRSWSCCDFSFCY